MLHYVLHVTKLVLGLRQKIDSTRDLMDQEHRRVNYSEKRQWGIVPYL